MILHCPLVFAPFACILRSLSLTTLTEYYLISIIGTLHYANPSGPRTNTEYPLMSWRDDPFSFSLSTKHSSTLGEWKTRVRFPSLFLVRKDSRILTFPVHERRSRKTLIRFAETPLHAVLATRDLSLSRILQSWAISLLFSRASFFSFALYLIRRKLCVCKLIVINYVISVKFIGQKKAYNDHKRCFETRYLFSSMHAQIVTSNMCSTGNTTVQNWWWIWMLVASRILFLPRNVVKDRSLDFNGWFFNRVDVLQCTKDENNSELGLSNNSSHISCAN